MESLCPGGQLGARETLPVVTCGTAGDVCGPWGESSLCDGLNPAGADLDRGEVYYPPHVYLWDRRLLVQLEQIRKLGEYFQRPARVFSLWST